MGRQPDRFTNDIDFKNGQAMRFAVSVQRELPGAWVLEAAYVGNRGFDLTTTTGQQVEQNPLPNQDPSTSPVRDLATINFLTATVPNPFQGLLPGTNLNGATIAAPATAAALSAVCRHPGTHVRRLEHLPTPVSSASRDGSARAIRCSPTYTYSRFKEKNRAPERWRHRGRRALSPI